MVYLPLYTSVSDTAVSDTADLTLLYLRVRPNKVKGQAVGEMDRAASRSTVGTTRPDPTHPLDSCQRGEERVRIERLEVERVSRLGGVGGVGCGSGLGLGGHGGAALQE